MSERDERPADSGPPSDAPSDAPTDAPTDAPDTVPAADPATTDPGADPAADPDPDAGRAIDIAAVHGFEALAALSFHEAERRQMLAQLRRFRDGYLQLRAEPLDNADAPAQRFEPRGPRFAPPPAGPLRPAPPPPVARPDDLEDTAFWTVPELAALLRSGEATSRELTEMYLTRLKRFDPLLRCVVTFTEETAVAQAERADRELASGVDRGPLHGIPWGAKDLLALPGHPTTWGAAPFRHQHRPGTATVIERLADAGAVLVAKLSLGALAMGDVWFGGTTRSPWDPQQGSSGSSAGSAAAVAAGLVGFAIGSETMGSIVSPATRCAVVGLRPSFGRVSRHGAMALSWSLDKLGPMARGVEDCALVLAAIHGPDGLDPTVSASPFPWDADRDPRALRVGYVAEAFEGEHDTREHDEALLADLREAGVDPQPVSLPAWPAESIMTVLFAEAAAAFDELTRSGLDDALTRQDDDAWPNLLRAARAIPAVEYLQAERARARAARELDELFERFDVLLCPSSHAPMLYLGNAAGVPTVTLPHAFGDDGVPLASAMTFTAAVDREADGLLLARLGQQRAWAREGRRKPALRR